MLSITFSKNSAEQLKTILRVPTTIYNSKLLAIRSEQIISSRLLLSQQTKTKTPTENVCWILKNFLQNQGKRHY